MDEFYLRLDCYHCGSIMEAWDHSAGKKSRCAKCDAPVKIPHFQYFKEFSGHKIMSLQIDDWNSPAWNAADHLSEKMELTSPVLYAKESSDGILLTETDTNQHEDENEKTRFVLPKDSALLKHADESKEAIIQPSIYDRDDYVEEGLYVTKRDEDR